MKTCSNLSKDFRDVAKYADTFVDVCICLQHSRVMLSLTITHTNTHCRKQITARISTIQCKTFHQQVVIWQNAHNKKHNHQQNLATNYLSNINVKHLKQKTPKCF